MSIIYSLRPVIIRNVRTERKINDPLFLNVARNRRRTCKQRVQEAQLPQTGRATLRVIVFFC